VAEGRTEHWGTLAASSPACLGSFVAPRPDFLVGASPAGREIADGAIPLCVSSDCWRVSSQEQPCCLDRRAAQTRLAKRGTPMNVTSSCPISVAWLLVGLGAAAAGCGSSGGSSPGTMTTQDGGAAEPDATKTEAG